jgi:hypothetical protein
VFLCGPYADDASPPDWLATGAHRVDGGSCACREDVSEIYSISHWKETVMAATTMVHVRVDENTKTRVAIAETIVKTRSTHFNNTV